MVSGEKIKRAVLLYGCFAALLFSSDIRPGQIFFTLAVHTSDVAVLYLPSKIFLSRNLQAGNFPEFSRELAGGFPVHAEGQGGFLYPPNLPFALFGSWIYNGQVILHLVFAALAMSLAMRRFGFSYGIALWSGLLFGFGGFFIGHLQHLNLTQAASWLGILFLFASAVKLKPPLQYKERGLLWAGFSGATLSLTLLSGFPQMTTIMALAIFAYWLTHLRRGNWRQPAFFILLSSACALLLASAQVLPQAILVKHSVRAGGVPWNEISSWSYQPKDLLMFFFPYIFGNPLEKSYIRSDGLFWENIAFVGWLPLFFAVAGAIRGWRSRWVRFWLAWVLFVFIFIMSNTFPLGRWLFEILPGMNLFRMPQRAILLAVFGILMLSARGLLGMAKRRSAFVFAVAFLISASEIFIFAKGYNYSVPLKRLLTPPETVRWIWEMTKKTKVTSVRRDGTQKRRVASALDLPILSEDPERLWLKVFYSVEPSKGNLEASLSYLKMLPPNYNLIFGISRKDVESPLMLKGPKPPAPFLLTTRLPERTMPLATFDIGPGFGKAFFLVRSRGDTLSPPRNISSAFYTGVFLSAISLAILLWFFVQGALYSEGWGGQTK